MHHFLPSLLFLIPYCDKRKEGNVSFNDALNTFYLRLYGVTHMVKDHSDSDKETRCCHIGYSFHLITRVLLYAPSHRHDNTYHSLCYTSRGALAGTRNSVKKVIQYCRICWMFLHWWSTKLSIAKQCFAAGSHHPQCVLSFL